MKSQNILKTISHNDKAALRGNPSYVWRAGQARRLQMILEAAGRRIQGIVLENGCGVGMYVDRLRQQGGWVVGLEYDLDYARLAQEKAPELVNAAGEHLPFPAGTFDLILSHEVIEHVQNDKQVVNEMVRALKPSGRLVLFCPNRGYPFETHGIFWKGKYKFGNIPFVNYLPRRFRDRLAPHVQVYTANDLRQIFQGLPVQFITRAVIFGAYDNIIARFPRAGPFLRAFLQTLERTPFRVFGLSHFWVIEKTG